MVFVTPVVEHWMEREIAQWVRNEGSIRQPITTLLPRSYISLLKMTVIKDDGQWPLSVDAELSG